MKLFRGRDTRSRVLSLLAQTRPDLSARELRGEQRLQQDLGLDSLSVVALAVRLHEEWGLDLVVLAEQAPSIVTVDDLVRTVENLTDGTE
ncbi:hypothetical protein J4573_15830 [Actinomadura barringtoniae]|uniref:Carrier domain-containing protein n=1 Tax=Actinomadura barringtoniae TaxID=1427535 RepID=A0A939P9Z5_9ACTN|nr:phosphopantetheine-binding protein [Actinomadura barringtoniae]MBO2448573.1 hypothetical protein [Actinomadura barringtoniae]